MYVDYRLSEFAMCCRGWCRMFLRFFLSPWWCWDDGEGGSWCYSYMFQLFLLLSLFASHLLSLESISFSSRQLFPLLLFFVSYFSVALALERDYPFWRPRHDARKCATMRASYDPLFASRSFIQRLLSTGYLRSPADELWLQVCPADV